MKDFDRYYPLKTDKTEIAEEERLLKLLRQPHVQNYVEACAKTLNETYQNNAKVLVDIRPGTRFKSTETNIEYLYEGSLIPFEHSDIARLVMQEAKRPVEKFREPAYFIIRAAPPKEQKITLGEIPGQPFLINAADFVSYFAIGVFQLVDLNNNDEKDLIERTWKP